MKYLDTISSPKWGRIKEREASEGFLTSCTGFPLPNPPPRRGRGLRNLPPPSWGRAGVGVVVSTDDRAKRNRFAPTLTLPRLGGGDVAQGRG